MVSEKQSTYTKAMNQKAMMFMVGENPELKDIHFNNNYISYGDKFMYLGDFNLLTLLEDYSPFRSDLGLMSAKDVFDIVGVNVFGKNQIDTHGSEQNLRDCYYRVLEGIPTGYREENITQGYDAFVYDLLCNQDYLTTEVRPLLGEYQGKMEEIALSENPSPRKASELEKYYAMQEQALAYQQRFKNEQAMKLEVKFPKEKAGYVRAISIAIATSILGIVIATLVSIYL